MLKVKKNNNTKYVTLCIEAICIDYFTLRM